MTPSYVYTQIKDRELLLPPCPIKNKNKQNLNKFCHYHDQAGHYTRECRDLLKQL